MAQLNNIHPGEILREEFLSPLSLSQNALANAIEVSPRRINEIVLEKRAITVDTDLRLSKFFGTSPGYWLNLQQTYDLEEKSKNMQNILKHIKRFHFKDDSNLNNGTYH